MPVPSRQMGSSKSHHWHDARRNHCALPAPQQCAGLSPSKSLMKMAPSLTPKISNGTFFSFLEVWKSMNQKDLPFPRREPMIFFTHAAYTVSCVRSRILSASWPSTISDYWISSINPSCPSPPSPHALPKGHPPPTSTASQLMDG
jgi:hypothetical protein